MPMPDINLKQAWLIPSAEALPNANGTAPAWLVTRPDGAADRRPARAAARDAADLVRPGPSPAPRARRRRRDARRGRSAWRASASRRSRTCSARSSSGPANPVVATYARAEAVDVRISARPARHERRPGRVRAGDRRRDRGPRPGPARRAHLGRRRGLVGRRDRGGAGRTRLDAGVRRGRDGRVVRRALGRSRVAAARRVAGARRARRRPTTPIRTTRATADVSVDRRAGGARPQRPGDRRQRRRRGIRVRAEGRRQRGDGRRGAAGPRPPRAADRVPRRRPGPPSGGSGRGARRCSRELRNETRRREPLDSPDAGRSAARRAARPVEVEHDDAVPLEADQAVVGEHAEKLVHALPGAADHRREVALRERRPQPDRPIGRLLPGFGGQPDEARREPAGDVEEVQLLDVVRQPAELSGERRQQRVADRRLGREQLAELRPRQDQRLCRLEGRCGGGSRRAVEQGELAEDVAGRSVARIASSPASDGSMILIAPLMTMNRASPGSPRWKITSPRRKRRVRIPRPTRSSARRVEPGEERDAGQRLGERASHDHEIHRTARRRPSSDPVRSADSRASRHRRGRRSVRRSSRAKLRASR